MPHSSRSQVELLIAVALGLVLIATARSEAQDGVRTVDLEEKTLELPSGRQVSYELGTLRVPENRTRSGSRTIGVGFARFRAVTPSSTPPLFLLPGGPGFSLVSLLDDADGRRLELMARDIETYTRVSDFVIVDQRGCSEQGDIIETTFSFPSSKVSEPRSLKTAREAYREFAEATVKKFADTEIDLSGYNVKECAHDVEDLRAALGYEKITLVGTSFGSQWSFAVMRLHPDSVARALLSGVEPLDHAYDMPSHVFAALQRMWFHVEQDERFAPYLPVGGIAEAARVVRDRLDQAPIVISAGGSSTSMVLGPEQFEVWNPTRILEMYHGHHAEWRKLVFRQNLGGPSRVKLIGPLIDSSLGVTPQRRHRLWTDPATRYIGRRNFALYLDTAEIWPSPDVGDDFRTPVRCEVPVVFAQGDWDTSTPLENTFEIAPFFPHSRVLIAERGGHGVLGPIARERPETWATIETFLRTGDLSQIPERVQLAPSRRFEPPDFDLPEEF